MPDWFESLSIADQKKMRKWLWILHRRKAGAAAPWVNFSYLVGIIATPYLFYWLLGVWHRLVFSIFWWDLLASVIAFVLGTLAALPFIPILKAYFYEKHGEQLIPKLSPRREFTVKALFQLALFTISVILTTYSLYYISEQDYWLSESPRAVHFICMAIVNFITMVPGLFYLAARIQYVLIVRRLNRQKNGRSA